MSLLANVSVSSKGQKFDVLMIFLSGINSCAQVTEWPKPHTIDMAALGLALMKQSGTEWRVTYDLSGAYHQCAIHPESLEFSHILVAVPGENRSLLSE